MSLTKVDSNEDPFQTAQPGRKREFLSFLRVPTCLPRPIQLWESSLSSAEPPLTQAQQTIRSFKGDLSSFTAPSFLLSPVSLIEHSSFWTEQPALFVAPAAEPDPAARALLVLKWYLAALMQQFGQRDKRKRKKPLNPFLGELFLGKFVDEDTDAGETELVAEQVSHHPPVTAYRVNNEKHGVRLHGYYAQRTHFSGTVRLERIGHVLLHYDRWDEDYLVTIPKVHLEGLFPPPPHPEIDGGSKIVSSSGFITEIEFSGKGWLRGKKNSFVARMYREEEGPEGVVYSAEGQWNGGSFVIRDGEGMTVETVDTAANRRLTPLTVPPIEEQDPLESRRAWAKVAQGIEAGDMATVTREKSKIEEEQRAMRKTELIEDREWQTRYFQKTDHWPEVEGLMKKIGGSVENERTKGVWRWAGKDKEET